MTYYGRGIVPVDMDSSRQLGGVRGGVGTDYSIAIDEAVSSSTLFHRGRV